MPIRKNPTNAAAAMRTKTRAIAIDFMSVPPFGPPWTGSFDAPCCCSSFSGFFFEKISRSLSFMSSAGVSAFFFRAKFLCTEYFFFTSKT